jgi:hypothetical protein
MTRFWLPDAGPFARVAIDYDPSSYLFALRCYRRDSRHALVPATAALNRFRLRELENTLVELRLTLPPVLQRYLVAKLSDDERTLEACVPHVRAMMCCDDACAAAQPPIDLAG